MRVSMGMLGSAWRPGNGGKRRWQQKRREGHGRTFTGFTMASGCPLPSWRFPNPFPLHTSLSSSNASWYPTACIGLMLPAQLSSSWLQQSWSAHTMLSHAFPLQPEAFPPLMTFSLLYLLLLKTCWYQDLWDSANLFLGLSHQNSPFNLNL